MPTQLTEVQAWEEVARIFAEGDVQSDRGLCKAFNALWYEERINRDVHSVMYSRIDSYLTQEQVYAYEKRQREYVDCAKNDEGRALAALWLMCEAAEEQGIKL